MPANDAAPKSIPHAEHAARDSYATQQFYAGSLDVEEYNLTVRKLVDACDVCRPAVGRIEVEDGRAVTYKHVGAYDVEKRHGFVTIDMGTDLRWYLTETEARSLRLGLGRVLRPQSAKAPTTEGQ